MSDCAHTALTCANCQADVSHLANRIRDLEELLRAARLWMPKESPTGKEIDKFLGSSQSDAEEKQT